MAREVAKLQEQGKEEAARSRRAGEAAAIFELIGPQRSRYYRFTLRLVGVKDDLAADDEAWLVVGVVRKARILLVGDGNDILNAFFNDRATHDVATITRLVPADLTRDVYRKPAQNGEFDLVIFDRCGPAREEDMPRVEHLFHRLSAAALENHGHGTSSSTRNQRLDAQAPGASLSWSPSGNRHRGGFQDQGPAAANAALDGNRSKCDGFVYAEPAVVHRSGHDFPILNSKSANGIPTGRFCRAFLFSCVT